MNLFVAGLSTTDGVVELSLGNQRVRLSDVSFDTHPLLRGYAGGNVVLGVRSEDLYPAATRSELPSLRAQLLNVEALGSETIAYMRLDAESLGVPVDDEDEALEPGDDPESIVAAKPNLVASFPPRVSLRLDEEVAVGLDTAHLHFFDVDTGAALR
jgi:ABC-type sugar transport system ATPase subunit